MANNGRTFKDTMNTIEEFNEKLDQAVWAILDAKRYAYKHDLPWNLEAINLEVISRVENIAQEAARIIRNNNQ